ncbi:hypothetical protein HJC23_002458 [Cyclotella cryptica]|uniref:Uncharacterized protein n=1 Tax=Cyclotella cryptica TaxID=29204 RepID=A0ABD3PVS3_9STRA|eukprot:CCRYP_011182-RA/>CCRYP_011182-RA protein AED:0.14 eAED:-0.17 QI:0/-1/0/1/-1/1/1/0/388
MNGNQFSPSLLLFLLLLTQIVSFGVSFQLLTQKRPFPARYNRVSRNHNQRIRPVGFPSIQSTLYTSEYRLYDVHPGEEIQCTQNYIASCQQIYPAIKPEPIVIDQVEEWYPTQYRTYRFFSRHGKDSGDVNDQGTTITIRQTSFGCGKLGFEVWKCALALSCHLISLLSNYHINGESDVESIRVLELGAGCGLPSCVCREMGVGGVLATDYWEEQNGNFGRPLDKERLVPHWLFGVNLDFNVVQGAGIISERKNEEQRSLSVRKLDWHNEVDVLEAKAVFNPNLIIASDVVYYVEDVPPLVRVLELLLEHASSGDSTTREVILFLSVYTERKGLNEFRRMVKEMVNTHSGWVSSEEEVDFSLMTKELDSFEEKYSILKLTITNRERAR